MANFDSGIKDFIVGECTIKVHFPIDWNGNVDVSCKHCPYLSSNERICQLNKKPVSYPQKFVGYDCPLTIVEK